MLIILLRLRDKFVLFSIYFAPKFLSLAIMQNALKLSIVSSQIIANDLNFRVPTIFPVPSIAISRLLILPTMQFPVPSIVLVFIGNTLFLRFLEITQLPNSLLCFT